MSTVTGTPPLGLRTIGQLHDDVILPQVRYQNPSVCCFSVQIRAIDV